MSCRLLGGNPGIEIRCCLPVQGTLVGQLSVSEHFYTRRAQNIF